MISRRCRPHGNVLIMAMCICVFLFFLCAALVAQNRQDIILALSEDHRVRATNAANAALDLGLLVMRTNPEWEAILLNESGQLETGGKWSVDSISRNATYPQLVEFRVKGQSGIISVSKTRVVEEVTMSSQSPNNAPTIFALTSDGDLAMLAPSFKWTRLGPAPSGDETILSANQGPLFTMLDHSCQANPIIEDLTPTGMSNINLPGENSSKVLWLDIANETISWKEISAPYDRAIEAEPQNRQLMRYKPSQQTGLDYVGPSLEWYALTGQAIAADKTQAYVFATHYFYLGAKGTITAQGCSLSRQGHTYSAPAVLRCSVNSQEWTVINDMMTVSDLDSAPYEHGKQPGAQLPSGLTLTLNNSELYAWSQSNYNTIIRAGVNHWSVWKSLPEPVSTGLYSYQNELIYHLGKGFEDGCGRVELSSELGFWSDLSFTRPAVNGYRSNSDSQDYALTKLLPEKRLRPTMLTTPGDGQAFPTSGHNRGQNCLAAAGNDLYTFVKMDIKHLVEGANTDGFVLPYSESFLNSSQHQQILTMAHYDGKRWQLWPNGLYDFSIQYMVARSQFVNTYELDLLPTCLAAAYYAPGQIVPLNHYSPIIDMVNTDE